MSDWQRQKGEPNRAHALFEQYLALGPARSLPSLARTGVASLSYLKKLSARWRWKERAAGWQSQVAASSHADASELAGAARERQLRDALTLQQLARAQLARWLARDEEGTLRLMKQLTPHQVARFWQTGYRLERDLLPPPALEHVPEWHQHRPPEQTQEQSLDLDLRRELGALVALLRKAGLRGARLAHIQAQVLRWLWLPEGMLNDPAGVSLAAPEKASSHRSRYHGQ